MGSRYGRDDARIGGKERAILDGADGQFVALHCEEGLEAQVRLRLERIRGEGHNE
jgi:hypothetical protein